MNKYALIENYTDGHETTINAWKMNNNDEGSEIIAVIVHETKTVEYRDSDARTDVYAQEMIRKVLREISKTPTDYKISFFKDFASSEILFDKHFNSPNELSDLLKTYEGFWCQVIDEKSNKLLLEGAFDDSCFDVLNDINEPDKALPSVTLQLSKESDFVDLYRILNNEKKSLEHSNHGHKEMLHLLEGCTTVRALNQRKYEELCIKNNDDKMKMCENLMKQLAPFLDKLL